MTTIRSYFSNPFDKNILITITGTYALSRFPDIPGRLFRLKTRSGNAGSFFIGTAWVTGQFPLPYEMESSYDTGWFSGNNLNEFYQNASSGSSYVSAWVQG